MTWRVRGFLQELSRRVTNLEFFLVYLKLTVLERSSL